MLGGDWLLRAGLWEGFGDLGRLYTIRVRLCTSCPRSGCGCDFDFGFDCGWDCEAGRGCGPEGALGGVSSSDSDFCFCFCFCFDFGFGFRCGSDWNGIGIESGTDCGADCREMVREGRVPGTTASRGASVVGTLVGPAMVSSLIVRQEEECLGAIGCDVSTRDTQQRHCSYWRCVMEEQLLYQ